MKRQRRRAESSGSEGPFGSDFLAIRETVTVGVCYIRISAESSLLGICEAVTVSVDGGLWFCGATNGYARILERKATSSEDSAVS